MAVKMMKIRVVVVVLVRVGGCDNGIVLAVAASEKRLASATILITRKGMLSASYSCTGI